MLDISVGKYTLESLTTGMYSDARIVYREYIQNSVDSLEIALSKGILDENDMRINIILDSDNSSISISDNGIGVSAKEASKVLVSIGNSTKHNQNSRGFRGIGRLGGMSYCERLVFKTSAYNEETKTIITFDCKKLKQLLIPDKNKTQDLVQLLTEITTIETKDANKEQHYFSVEMFGVDANSGLLQLYPKNGKPKSEEEEIEEENKDDTIGKYISQVAPLPYDKHNFSFAVNIKEYTAEKGYNVEEFPIYIGESIPELEKLYKANKTDFIAGKGTEKNDSITGITNFTIVVEGELYAIGWYGMCGWYGSIADKKIAGIRVKKGNIQIGDSKTLDPIFTQSRFNRWVQGEVFVVSDRLIPNARRDDFEKNEAYYKLIEQLSDKVGKKIASKIRDASKLRNDSIGKTINLAKQSLNNAEDVLAKGFNSNVDKKRTMEELATTEAKLRALSIKADDKRGDKKEDLDKKLKALHNQVKESNNYKINQIKPGLDRKTKKAIQMITDILSKRLSKILVDDIMVDIIEALNKQ